MLSNDAKAMINYINKILNNKKLNHATPKIAEGDADFLQLEQSLWSIKNVAERHRLMTDNACDIIATVDLAGNFTYISPYRKS